MTPNKHITQDSGLIVVGSLGAVVIEDVPCSKSSPDRGKQRHLQKSCSYLDDDNSSNDNTKQAEFLDAHGLLLELQEDLAVLMDPKFTHVGVGFAADKNMVNM